MSKLYVLLSIFVFVWKYSAGLSPVIFLPGLEGSQLETKYNKTEVVRPWCKKVQTTYFTVWVNLLELLPIFVPNIDCFVDNTRLVYDNVTRTTKNTAGVDIRVPGWGSTETVEFLDSLHIINYFNIMADALVTIGYVRNISLRGAPYDFRKAANENGEFFVELKVLVEETYAMNNNTPITLISHSMGGLMAQYFLKLQTQEWKDQYIKRLIALSTPWGGTMVALQSLATGIDLGYLLLSWKEIRALLRTWPSIAWLLPSALFWEPTEVLVQTTECNYTINDLHKLFLDMNVPDVWEMRKDTESLTGDLTAPGVELHCLYGTGVSTAERLVYLPGEVLDKDDEPIVVSGDGDGVVNIRSLTGCDYWKTSDSNQGYSVTSVPFTDAEHIIIMYDVRVLTYITSILKKSEDD